MKHYCDFCGEGFDYKLHIDTAKLPEGGTVTVALCELCYEKYANGLLAPHAADRADAAIESTGA